MMGSRYSILAASMLACGFVALPSRAFEPKTPVADTLNTRQSHLLDSLENAFSVPQPCGGTLASDIRKNAECPIAVRLHAFVKWLVIRNTSPVTVTLETQRRYESLTSTRTGTIDTTHYAIAGDPHAPVLITGYVSAVCPICHFVTHELYDAVTTGELAGKARLMVKPLGNGFANRSLVAANDMGRFWDYFIALAKSKERVSKELIYGIADSLNMPHEEFARRTGSAEADSVANASTAEAAANGVTIAPTFFVNRVRYHSYKDPMWLIDAVQYRYESLKKR